VAAPVLLYNIENYSFGTKEAKAPKDASVEARMTRLEERYHQQGCVIVTFACAGDCSSPCRPPQCAKERRGGRAGTSARAPTHPSAARGAPRELARRPSRFLSAARRCAGNGRRPSLLLAWWSTSCRSVPEHMPARTQHASVSGGSSPQLDGARRRALLERCPLTYDDRCVPLAGEGELAGVRRKLTTKLGVPGATESPWQVRILS
jgi:hypothetical protein